MNTQLEMIESDIELCKQHMALEEKLNRLFDNEDFKELILDGYFKTEVDRLINMMLDPRFEEAATKQLLGISGLKNYFMLLENIIAQSKTQLVELQETYQQLLNDGE